MTMVIASDPARTNAPIYIQLACGLRHQIESGDIQSGDALPSERDLCRIMGASRVTVRKAIELLIDEGLLTRRQGSGTFVARRIEAPGSLVTSFSEDAAARGAPTRAIWVNKAHDSASEEEARLLEVPFGAAILRLSRVRLAADEPLAIEHAVVPATMLPSLDSVGLSLYAALADSGNRPVRGAQRIRAGLASASEAALLAIAELSEILRIERLTRRADGVPVELTKSAYRGDRYDIVSELSGPITPL